MKTLIFTVILSVLIATSCTQQQPKTPEETIAVFVESIVNRNIDGMLSVSGSSEGEKIDKYALAALKQQMVESYSADDNTLPPIANYRVISVDIVENKALCKIEFTFNDSTTCIDEGTVLKGADGVWRIPLVELQ